METMTKVFLGKLVPFSPRRKTHL